MAKASNIYGENVAKEGKISARNTLAANNSTELAEYLTDVVSTLLYTYQSIPVAVNGVQTARYQQYIRNEVILNANVYNPNCVLTSDDACWTWGSNANGQLGNSSTTNSSVPISVIGDFHFNQVVSDMNTVVGSKDDGTVWAWGKNTYGTLGDNTTVDKSSPVSVNISRIVNVSCVDDAFFALDMNGGVWSWGRNNNYQLGDGSTIDRSSPVSLNRSFVAVRGNIGIDEVNNCWAWGVNSSGQCGVGHTNAVISPTRVFAPCGLNSNTIMAIKNNNFALTLNTSGLCFTFGTNTYGSLGDNTTANKSSPVSVQGIQAKIKDIAIGDNHALALDEYGIIWSWGRNHVGQLGNGTTTDRSLPMTVYKGITKFIQISAYKDSSLAVDEDGNVWLWGNVLTTNSTASLPVSIKNFSARLTKIY